MNKGDNKYQVFCIFSGTSSLLLIKKIEILSFMWFLKFKLLMPSKWYTHHLEMPEKLLVVQASINVHTKGSNFPQVANTSIPANQRMTHEAYDACPSGSSIQNQDCSESECEWEELAECETLLAGLQDEYPADSDAVMRGLLEHIIHTYTREDGNHLQPSETQHQLVTHFVEEGIIYEPFNLSNSEWLDIMGDGSMLFSIVSDETREDIECRASAVVNALINTEQTHVTLLDGHGRVVYQILAELHNRGFGVDDYTFTLYDLDGDVHEWHRVFMPSSVTSYHDDIMCSGRNRLRSLADLPGVVYLNFCGIADCVEQTRDMIHAITNAGRCIMVSYSTRGMSRERNTAFRSFHKMVLSMQHARKNRPVAQFISEHGQGSNCFCTYAFSHFTDNPFDCPDDEEDLDYVDEEEEESYGDKEDDCEGEDEDDCEDDCEGDEEDETEEMDWEEY